MSFVNKQINSARSLQEKDETDSGYRSGTIPDEKLPPKPSDATLNREELKKRIAEFNKFNPGANFALVSMMVDKSFSFIISFCLEKKLKVTTWVIQVSKEETNWLILWNKAVLSIKIL